MKESRTAVVIAVLSWAIALSSWQLDRRFGPGQQRVTIRWSDVSDIERRMAEDRLTLQDGEETEPGKWVYRLADRSPENISQIVRFPGVADTAHIDAARLRVTIDAPELPALLRRFLEAGLALPFSLCAAAVGLIGFWFARREVARTVRRAAIGRDDYPRHARAVRPDTAHAVPRYISAALLTVQDDWDWWAGRLYYPIIGVLIAFMLFYTGWHGHELALDWDGWTIGDWLISYSGGFVRRGLSGELVLAASRGAGMSANLTAWTLFVAVFAVFGAAFAALLGTRRVTFWYFALCLSPVFLLFTLYNPDTVGRKDALLLASVALWAVTASRGPLTVGRAATFAAMAFVLTLMHELIFFFTPYFVLISYLHARERLSNERWWLSALVPAGSACAMLIVLVSSGSLVEPARCERLIAAGAPANACEGVLSYGHESVPEAAREFLGAADGQAGRSFVTAAALTILPPMLFLLISSASTRTAYAGIIAILGAVLFSTPLFVLALDWGRWLAIHATLATLACALVLPGRDLLPFRPRVTARSLISLVAGVAVVAMMFGWNVKHCCRATLVTSYPPFQAVTEMWEEFEF